MLEANKLFQKSWSFSRSTVIFERDPYQHIQAKGWVTTCHVSFGRLCFYGATTPCEGHWTFRTMWVIMWAHERLQGICRLPSHPLGPLRCGPISSGNSSDVVEAKQTLGCAKHLSCVWISPAKYRQSRLSIILLYWVLCRTTNSLTAASEVKTYLCYIFRPIAARDRFQMHASLYYQLPDVEQKPRNSQEAAGRRSMCWDLKHQNAAVLWSSRHTHKQMQNSWTWIIKKCSARNSDGSCQRESFANGGDMLASSGKKWDAWKRRNAVHEDLRAYSWLQIYCRNTGGKSNRNLSCSLNPWSQPPVGLDTAWNGRNPGQKMPYRMFQPFHRQDENAKRDKPETASWFSVWSAAAPHHWCDPHGFINDASRAPCTSL